MGDIPLSDVSTIGAAVVGTGFIGAVHLSTLRRLGIPIIGVLGSSASRGAERAKALGVAKAYGSLDELLADPAVQVVHVTSPNVAHYPQVKAILAAGKHVICEKPLAMTSSQSAEMVQMARASGKVAAVCYNTRFYPLNQHAHGMMKVGELGDLRLITGHFHQDWLAKDTDWNWRLEASEGGPLRSVSDIGTHWVDLTNFVTGQKPVSVMAELATFIPERQKPPGAAVLGHLRLKSLGRLVRRTPRGSVDRPPRGAEPDPPPRPVADEPDRGRRRLHARRPSRRLCRHLGRLLHASLPRCRTRGPGRGVHLGHL